MSRPATVRLLTVWVVVALALPAWAALTAARAPEISVDSGAAVDSDRTPQCHTPVKHSIQKLAAFQRFELEHQSPSKSQSLQERRRGK